MKKNFFRSFLVLCLTLVLVLTASVLPASAASNSVVYATSPDGSISYTSIVTAWDAVKNGGTIVMQRDWTLSERLELKANEKGTIYMNGYKIDRGLTRSKSDGEVIYMNKDSSLTLKGCDADGNNITGKKFEVKGRNLSGTTSGKITSGGLITGGYSSNGAGGIHMKEDANLTLDNVIVGGNKASSDYGGGVNMNNVGDSLKLKNGAAIAYNVAEFGGGVYVATHHCKISLSGGSAIAYNYATESGGGIYSYGSYTTVELTESSAISNNIAGEDGGGYYGYYSRNTIESSDKTGLMTYNFANDSGGAIFLESAILSENKNSISGICFDGNPCHSCGGAMYLNQESTTVSDCVIKNNSATNIYIGMGGGIYNANDENVFENCTITGNYAEKYGGGFYQGLYNNIQLSGKVVIKNNTRAGGDPDDLYLGNHSLSTAYITSKPDAGSEIGIKIYADGSERKIGEGMGFDETVFFSDTQGYYIRYDSTAKEMYLTPNNGVNKSYSVTVNGKLQGYYSSDAKLTIDGTPSDSSKAFKEWNGDWTTLDSRDKAVASVLKVEKNLTFTAKYVTRASDFTLTVEKPVAGSALPTYGNLIWQGDVTTLSYDVDVYWLIQNDGGTTQTVSGIADYNTNYSVAAVIDADPSEDLAFTDKVTGTVIYTDADGESQTDQTHTVYVDDTHSTLYMYGKQIKTEKADIARVEDAVVTITKGSSEDALKNLLPKTAVVYDKDDKEYIVNTDLDNADLSGATTGSTVNDNGGSVVIPLKLEGTEKVKNGTGDEEKKLTVTVNVTTNGILAVPTVNVDPGTYKNKDTDGNVKLKITLTAEQDATIYYKVSDAAYEANAANDAEDYVAYNSATGITISAAAGTKESFTIKTYAGGKTGYVNSAIASYTYVLDNPYTVTITKKSTASQDGQDGEDGQDGAEIGEKYIAQYYQGNTVIIGAPVVEEYAFDSWQQTEGGVTSITIDGSNAKDNPLPATSIQNNISLTALYNPITKSESSELAEPADSKNQSSDATISKGSSSGKHTDQKADTTIDQTETVKAKVATLELMARSSKTAMKNIKVALKMSTEAQATIDEIQSLGYTVKYKFYRSTKKSASYKPMLEKASKTYTNTTGKKGTRYYYKARVMVYDSEGNLVTKTELKQCKYACRVR